MHNVLISTNLPRPYISPTLDLPLAAILVTNLQNNSYTLVLHKNLQNNLLLYFTVQYKWIVRIISLYRYRVDFVLVSVAFKCKFRV